MQSFKSELRHTSPTREGVDERLHATLQIAPIHFSVEWTQATRFTKLAADARLEVAVQHDRLILERQQSRVQGRVADLATGEAAAQRDALAQGRADPML